MPYQDYSNFRKKHVNPTPLRAAVPQNEYVRPRQPMQREMPVFTPRQTLHAYQSYQPQPASAVPSRSDLNPRRSFRRPLTAAVLLGVAAFAMFHIFAGSHSVAQAIKSASPLSDVAKLVQPTQTSAATAQELRLKAYSDTVNSLISAHPSEDIAVSTVDLSGSNKLTLGDQGTFTAASTAKLITAITLLHQVEQGRASLTQYADGQQVGTLLQNMIVNSDNDAWEALNNDYLSHDDLKSYMSSLGLTNYDPDVNTVLPADMAMLMQKFYGGQLINKSHTRLLLSYMQQANKREYIVAAVPRGYTVYHKAGWLDGLMHDVAIISNGQKTIVLAIYSYNSTAQGDGTVNQDLFKRITDAAIKAYF